MRLKTIHRSCLMIGLLLGGCNASKQEAEEEPLTYKIETFEKSNCSDGEESCAEVKMSYPTFSGGEDTTNVLLNIHVLEQLKMYLQWGEKANNLPSLDELADGFLVEFDAFKQEFPTSSQSWYSETEAKVGFMKEGLVSIEFLNSAYTGGAHPNYVSQYLNYDLEQRSLLKNEDLILDEAKLREMAEQAFRKHHEVKEGVSLKDDGRFFLDDGAFFLPAAMGYEGEEFVLLYNTYEITPYSMGQTALKFPLSALEGVVKQ
ncbi:DUF3298 and DUF4163 domain-containing protein [Echinicola marina]|uniref:DUF3298 and DUF4163 domain-containing protein n=1 Tax=Echinicola marina TaxID=2859768 RepID=UPI001CF61305|nr:DUF3298 and DUF4163 domain-containing protein [Echinicola marina]UCS93467.1 DUF3298 and DUF4163 domain-containing protein [Echinicola marina]